MLPVNNDSTREELNRGKYCHIFIYPLFSYSKNLK